MRSMWTGAVSFGLVNIPVRMYSAIGEERISFNLLHAEDKSPIRYAKVCKQDGKELTKDDVVKGYEYADGEYVVMEDQDFENASPKLTKAVEIVDFVDQAEIADIFFEKPYYLEPDKGAARAYSLLREVMAKSKKVGIGRFVLRDKEHLCAIVPMGKVLVLDQLRFASEIRSYEPLSLPEKSEPNEREMELAMALVDKMTGTFRPEEYRDTYTEALREVIQAKIEGRAAAPREEAPEPTNLVDLMSVLKQSLEGERKAA